jgi:very-short-patch-repair endonuclease
MINSVRKPTWRISPKLRSRAKTLRQNMTAAERTVWHELRAHRFLGAAFRRQTPVGSYIVDFVSHTTKLIIELDGGQHFGGNQIEYDTRRDAFLSSRGYCVLRFSNHDVMTNKSGVLELIAAALVRPKGPLPNPPPQAGEGAGQRCGELP